MLRYLIAAWDPANPRDIALANNLRHRSRNVNDGWRHTVFGPGFYSGYFADNFSDDLPILLHDDHGIIFGNLYEAASNDGSPSLARLRSLSTTRSKGITRSAGRSLISQYWGYYVAAFRVRNGSGIMIMRSPVSPLPCFHLHIHTFHIFSSNLKDITALHLCPLSINWDSITAQVVGRNYLTHETAITQIESMECGEVIDYTANGYRKRYLWNPRDYLRDKSLDTFPAASAAVRQAVDYSVNSLASHHSNILLTLSGGLDSSIIASALARAPHKPTVTAVNYYSRGCGDERYYARAVCQSMDLRLIECTRNDGLRLDHFVRCNMNVRPALSFSAPDVEVRNAGLARELNASAIFDGELGDNVFGRALGAGALLEGLRRKGTGPAFLSLALDYSMLAKQSIWQTIALTNQERLRTAANHDIDVFERIQYRYGIEGASSRTLASVDAEQHHVSMQDRYIHPWFKGTRNLAPGSDRLLYGLVVVTSSLYHSPFGAETDPIQVSPLMSQPLVEVVMRIPGYLHCKNGQDRAVARHAFGDALPAEVLNRRAGKGGPDSWLKDIVNNNIPFLRSFLLDGILVQRGLIDRKKLETALSPRIEKSSAVVTDIFAKLYIETWLKNFQTIETSSSSHG